MKHLHTRLLIMVTIVMVPSIQACKTMITNNSNETYQLKDAKHGTHKKLPPKGTVSFGGPTEMASFIIANNNGHPIQRVEQTTCAGDKGVKKLTMNGINGAKLGKHADKFKITKL